MTISIGTYSFPTSSYHGTPECPGWEFASSVQKFFGIVGEYHMVGQPTGRPVKIAYTLTGYASRTAIQAAATVLSNQIGTSGSLVIDHGGGDITTFANSKFDSWEPSEAAWYDGSGVNGWQQSGTLMFRQVAT